MATPSERKLMGLLVEIFADNIVTPDERQDLIELQAELRPELVTRVFAAFVQKKWGEAIADGVVTDEEKMVLHRVLEELQLPDAALPPGLLRALQPGR